MKRWSAIVVASLGAVMACKTAGVAPADGPLDTRPAEALPPLTLTGDWPVDRGDQGLWQRVAQGDEWSTLELARVAGPGELLASLEAGGPQAQAAAQAWPHVPTAWLFRGQWCLHAQRYEVLDWAVLLRALSESAGQRDTVGEEVEPESRGQCERWLGLASRQVAGEAAVQFGAVRDALDAAQTALSPANVAPQP